MSDFAKDINVPINDFISRQAAIDALGERPLIWSDEDEFALGERNQYDSDKLAIETVPSADVVPVKHARWVLDEDPHDGDCRCSACLVCIDQMHERNHKLLNAITGNKWWTFYKYCPNCGAEMTEENDG